MKKILRKLVMKWLDIKEYPRAMAIAHINDTMVQMHKERFYPMFVCRVRGGRFKVTKYQEVLIDTDCIETYQKELSELYFAELKRRRETNWIPPSGDSRRK